MMGHLLRTEAIGARLSGVVKAEGAWRGRIARSCAERRLHQALRRGVMLACRLEIFMLQAAL